MEQSTSTVQQIQPRPAHIQVDYKTHNRLKRFSAINGGRLGENASRAINDWLDRQEAAGHNA